MKKYARSPTSKVDIKNQIVEDFKDDINQYYFKREKLGYRYFRRYHTGIYKVPKVDFSQVGYRFTKKTLRIEGVNLNYLVLFKVIMYEYIRLFFFSCTQQKNLDIWGDFIVAWPKCKREVIEGLTASKNLKNLLGNYRGRLQSEHGDFTRNNLKFNSEGIYVTDFDFFKGRQPAGFDLYDMLRSYNLPQFFLRLLVPNYKINKEKYDLISQINDYVDASEGLRVGVLCLEQPIAQEIMKESLLDANPLELYTFNPKKIKKYHLHYIYSNTKKRYLAIVLEKNRRGLTFAGVDGGAKEGSLSSFLTKVGPNWLRSLVRNQFDTIKLEGLIDQNWIKLAIYEFENDEAYDLKINVSSLQPYRQSNIPLKKNLREDYRRLKRKIETLGGYRSDLDVCSDKLFETVKLWHSARWPKGQFAQGGPFMDYVTALVREKRLFCFTLRIDGEIMAVNCGTLIDNTFISLINTHSQKKSELSLGKFLIMDVVQKYETINFNFGDGAEQYKRMLSTNADLIYDFELKGNQTIHRLKQIKRTFI